MKMEEVDCNLCGCSDTRVVMHAEDVRYGFPGKWRLVCCVSCGLVFVSPRPNLVEIGSYYPVRYAEHSSNSGLTLFASYQASMVHQLHPIPGHLLDVGCASGYFLKAMRDLNWKASGVEPDPIAAHLASTVNNATVKQGTLERDDYPADTFDVITFWSVLEHLHDPIETLRSAHLVLRPGGSLFVLVPNYGSLERRLFGQWWFNLDVPRHLFHFTPSTLQRLVEATGFSISSVAHTSGHDGIRQSLRMKRGRSTAVGGDLTVSSESPSSEFVGLAKGIRRKLNGHLVGAFTRLADAARAGGQICMVCRKSQ